MALNCTMQAFDPRDEGRREIGMSDVNEDSLDGELPFLPRDTRDSEEGNDERRRRTSGGGLPTHQTPPRGFARRYAACFRCVCPSKWMYVEGVVKTC